MATIPGHLRVARKMIWVDEEVKQFLDEHKKVPMETYNHALRRLLKLPGLS